MNIPYCVSSKELSRIKLWRSEDHYFRIVEFDKPIPLLDNPDYILIEKQLSKPFENLEKDQLEMNPVLIERKVTNQRWDNYLELKIKNHLSPENIHHVNADGLRVWQYDQYLFVSPELKKKLELFSNDALTFSEGFSEFI